MISLKEYLLRQNGGHLILVESITGGEHLGRAFLAGQEVDDVQKAVQRAILRLLANRNKSDRNT